MCMTDSLCCTPETNTNCKSKKKDHAAIQVCVQLFSLLVAKCILLLLTFDKYPLV